MHVPTHSGDANKSRDLIQYIIRRTYLHTKVGVNLGVNLELWATKPRVKST